MKKLSLVLLLLVFSGSAYADWELATFNMQHQPNPEQMAGGYKKCFYRTIGGYEFSIVTKEWACPVNVQIMPETGQVKKL